SQSVLYRRLKETTGESVIDFIKKIRLKKAAQLLRQPQVRVSEVAFLVGIEDPKNFRTSFKRIYNISPSQYARFYGQN
ncbi:MAG TPA: helix-turn-helix transcriptional regulator, partial [Dyadobacter sp.]|nr:helix-turn-helix transcriptional regulator [Dyadobacter sp.]